MNKPIISIIVAMDEKRGIGKKNQLMWRIPGELPRFKRITMGHPVIMGRKTYESIGRPLPGRTNIIITREKNYLAIGCIICTSIEEALHLAEAKDQAEVFIIGGGEIYNQALSFTEKIYLTLVKGDFNADTFFPDYSEFKKVISEEDHEDEKYKYTFLELER